MGIIHIDLFITLDGVAQAPGGQQEDTDGGFAFGGWQAGFPDHAVGGFAFGGWQAGFPDHAVGGQILAGMQGMDALLLGRRTYDIFASYWPQVKDGAGEANIAQQLNRIPKYVASRQMRNLEWQGSTLLGADLPAAVQEVRDRHENVHVIGSLNLVQTLLSEQLFDQLNLWVYPILLGSGKKIFADGAVPTNLKLMGDAVTSPMGIVQLQCALDEGVPVTGNMAGD